MKPQGIKRIGVSMQDLSEKRFRRDYSMRDILYGYYLGKVENDCDPLQIGRVQVRIPVIHGESKEEGIPTETLPWAFVVYGGASGWDCGSFNPPIIGTDVVLIFHMGQRDHPIVLGTYQGVPSTEEASDNDSRQDTTQYGVSPNAENERGVPLDGNSAMGEWWGKNRPETPKESQMMRESEPGRRVIFKTPKGASMIIDEGKETESLSVVDRAGQGMIIKGRVLGEKSEGNAEQRGRRTTFSGNQATYNDTMQDADTTVRIQDATSQGLRIKGKRGEERVRLQSKQPSFEHDECAKKEIRVFDVGDERQTFELNAGHGITAYEGLREGEVKIKARYDTNRPIIEIEATGEGSTIVVNGNRFTVGANTIVMEGDMQFNGDVMIDGNLLVTGNIVEGELIEEGSENYR